MKIKLFLTVGIFAALLGLGLMPAHVAAYSLFPVDCSGEAAKSAVCQDKDKAGDNPLLGTNGVITRIIEVLSVVAGITAVFVLFIAGITFATAGGDAGRIKAAQDMIRFAVIGLVVIAVSGSLVSYVLIYFTKG